MWWRLNKKKILIVTWWGNLHHSFWCSNNLSARLECVVGKINNFNSSGNDGVAYRISRMIWKMKIFVAFQTLCPYEKNEWEQRMNFHILYSIRKRWYYEYENSGLSWNGLEFSYMTGVPVIFFLFAHLSHDFVIRLFSGQFPFAKNECMYNVVSHFPM